MKKFIIFTIYTTFLAVQSQLYGNFLIILSKIPSYDHQESRNFKEKLVPDDDKCTESYYKFVLGRGPVYFSCNQISVTITPVTESNFEGATIEPKIKTKSHSLHKQRISEQKCKEYSRTSKVNFRLASSGLDSNFIKTPQSQCKSGGLIVDGRNATAGEFPHMAAIAYKSRNNQIDFRCGGSLISERFVLTAAHCNRPTATFARIGDLNLKLKEPELPEIDVLIMNFKSHEFYNPKTHKNDIAVIKHAWDVEFSRYVQPACLMLINNIEINKAIATGWGYTDSARTKQSEHLQKVKISIINLDECIEIYKNRTKFNLDDSQVCAGELTGGKDTCNGDSGGPLQVTSDIDECFYTIIGITSYGNSKCGSENSPGVYTKVSAHIDWIEQNVWGL